MKSRASNRAVFLDRDGVLMEDANYVGQVERVRLIPGTPAALARLQAAGFRLFVVTNQSGVARGYFSRAAVDQIHRHLDECFQQHGVTIDHYYICPHHPDDQCECRKPSPKFLIKAGQTYRLNLAACYMVGDRTSDIETGLRAGTQTILVLTGAGRETFARAEVLPTHVSANISESADWILSQSQA